jgi:hypothetical protein
MGNRAKGGFGDNPQNINRAGRPKKGKTLTDILEKHGKRRDIEYVDEKTGEVKKRSRKEELARELWALAMDGDIQAIKYIYDRIDGKPTEHQEITGDIGIEIEYVENESEDQ